MRPRVYDVVQVVLRALIPIAGILFLGWSAGNVIFVYCADVLASVYAVCVLACGRLFAMEPAGGPAWWRRLSYGLQLAVTALAPWAAIALPLAGTMAMVLALAGFDWRGALTSRGLWIATAAQFGTAVSLLLRDYDLVEARNADWQIKRRFGLVFLRWAIVLVVGWSVLAALPHYGFTIVIACTLATLFLELAPNRTLRAFGAAELAAMPGQRQRR
jgi:hypothetical protein